MAAGRGGSIINISASAPCAHRPNIFPYSAAKAGLNAMTVGWRDAFGPKVRVNAIMAGHVPHRRFEQGVGHGGVRRAHAKGFALGRRRRADEIVGAALYLASDASSYTTGSILTVDGGAQWSMPGGGGADANAARSDRAPDR